MNGPSRALMVLRSLAGILLAMDFGSFFSFCSFAFAARGGDPESVHAVEPVIPYLALFLAMAPLGYRLAGHGGSPWWNIPLVIAIFFVGAWFCYQCYMLARY